MHTCFILGRTNTASSNKLDEFTFISVLERVYKLSSVYPIQIKSLSCKWDDLNHVYENLLELDVKIKVENLLAGARY